MGLTTRKNEPFTTLTKNSAVQGDNTVFIKGGATVIGDRWVQFDDLKVNVGTLVDSWVTTRATRLFNKKDGILYVLVTLSQDQTFEIVPSISLNKTVKGNVTSFEDLSGKLPLILVRLEQDGTNDISKYKPITSGMIEVYKGYGNFTLRGESGLTGPVGDTGAAGIEGYAGLKGYIGAKGLDGSMGARGSQGLMGMTGVAGIIGAPLYRYTVERDTPPLADFIASPLEGLSPLIVQFTNLSTGTWETISWSFGDGGLSSDENPLHTYLTHGTYSVSLYLQMTDGNSEKIKYDYIVVTENPCFIQDVVDDSEDGWQGVVDATEDGIQNVLGECS